ncbi:SDR family oxidoreductase [Leucobacter sp. USHLN154]|uniref:SDR family oxidoreductase n=1 Tax=Leucobacter sp. USHLN154 TaxID=3081269 RepID=UPI00301838AA
MSVLVTGATGGIGGAIVRELQCSGHEVITQDLRATDALTPDIVGDLLESETMREVVERCRQDGVTSVIAAHGIAAAAAVSQTSREFSDRAMRINTLTFIELFDALETLIEDRDGAYVAISSQAGLVGEANNGAYCASKFALVGWARKRLDDGRGRLRILCPGATETPLLEDALRGMAEAQGIRYEDLLSARNAQTPAGRLGSTAELARAARLLVELDSPRLLIAPVTGGEVMY